MYTKSSPPPSGMLLKGLGSLSLGLLWLLTLPSPEPRIFSPLFQSSFILNLMLPSLFPLSVDASDTHLDAVLQQLLDGSWAPLGLISKKLSDVEKKYSAFDCELLAAYFSLHHFRFMLEGREFTIFMDHKPLTHALLRVSPPLVHPSAASSLLSGGVNQLHCSYSWSKECGS